MGRQSGVHIYIARPEERRVEEEGQMVLVCIQHEIDIGRYQDPMYVNFEAVM